ncbi:phage integrase SAM-like domain-containing protein [Lewinella sp. W8]|uniref:phage integrase SAM-like domain-containing protein n=1 Tax=Lewinella sp. W8 TaxID=2528208 RepID=UPI0010688B5D|nr:phage integrase SAM-like domain-containing protein [Lewinella sp. W8]MTB53941.1 tyrosine-type recombinase/integrase [Lewinella sp. W8]
MTVRSILWKYKPRRDGTCNIKLSIYADGKRKFEKTQFYADPKDWDEKRGRLKRTAPLADKINGILTRLETEAKGELLGVSSSLIQFVAQYIKDCRAGLEDLRPGTWKKFISFEKKLRAFAAVNGRDDIAFEDINMTFYKDFTQFMRENGTGRSGVANHIKHLKKFMQMGLDQELHKNVVFKTKPFRVDRFRANDKIYLTVDEIDALAQLDLSNYPSLERERDRFLVSYYMVLRYGDSIRINKANISQHGGTHYYKNVAEKTDIVSFVPIKPAALELIKKNNYDLSGDTNQEANRKLKVIAAMAGILTNVAPPGKGHIPKSSLVTTHTARRSAATNLLLSGVPLSEIMQLGGWKYEATLKQYLLAGGIRLAELSAGREFFR